MGEGLRQRFAQADHFVVAAELVTSRGLVTARTSRALIDLAHALGADPRFDVLSITDNPGGNAMLAPDTLGAELVAGGQEVIIHLSCKDWNRNALESRGWKLGSEGMHNVLALSGDYPVSGHRGLAEPVFDLDAVGLLQLYGDMNAGLRDPRRPDAPLEGTDFFLGCVVTNHKRLEREVVPQYLKLVKKARAGARFVINQIGWDARKDDELLRFIRHERLGLRTLANVYLLSAPAARVFSSGRIPGVVVSDELLGVAERQGASPDKGRGFFVELAARQVAVARGLGYDGVYLGGHMTARTFGEILDRAQGYAAADWCALAREIRYALPGEFHLFEADPETGLSSDALAASYLQDRSRRHTDLPVPFSYRVSRRMHQAVFAPQAPLFDAGTRIYDRLQRAPRPARRLAHGLEQAAKLPMFSCRDCGDCSLPETAYVCPESMCAKNQRNGPCGGTRDGLCEVYDTECIWSQAYERLKAYGEEREMLDGPVVVKDNALSHTSAWANTFLKRDHTTRETDR